MITGVVNQTSGETTVTGQDGISVGVNNIAESNMDSFNGWFYPATFNVTSTGTYNLSGGTLTAGFETINGIMTQSGTTTNTLQSNPNGSAVYIHCTGLGSSNCTTIVAEQGTVGQLNVVGTGAQYNLESGTLNAPTLVLDSGGTFTQTGGVATVVEGQPEDQTLTTQPSSGLYVGYNGSGTYSLYLGHLELHLGDRQLLHGKSAYRSHGRSLRIQLRREGLHSDAGQRRRRGLYCNAGRGERFSRDTCIERSRKGHFVVVRHASACRNSFAGYLLRISIALVWHAGDCS